MILHHSSVTTINHLNSITFYAFLIVNIFKMSLMDELKVDTVVQFSIWYTIHVWNILTCPASQFNEKSWMEWRIWGGFLARFCHETRHKRPRIDKLMQLPLLVWSRPRLGVKHEKRLRTNIVFKFRLYMQCDVGTKRLTFVHSKCGWILNKERKIELNIFYHFSSHNAKIWLNLWMSCE
jgi:hypothetical protein